MSERLRALALAATPGPWGRDACRITAKELGWARVADTEFDNDSMAENAAFIAAANPAAILALLDELEDSHKAYELLFKENAELRKDANNCGSGAGCCYQAAQNERLELELQQAREERTALLVNEQSLREELAALRASLGEPVAWDVYVKEADKGYLIDRLDDQQYIDDATNHGAVATPLFAIKDTK
jgi:hypothetical protein